MKKLILGFGALALLSLSSCSKEDDGNDDNTTVVTTVAQDKASLAATQNGLISCVKALHDGKGVQSVVDFFNVVNGDALDTTFVKGLLDSLGSVVAENVFDETDGFNFDNAAGTYTYTVGTKQWTYSSAPTDKIIVNFPSDKNKTTSNVQITSTKLVTKQYINDGDTTLYPESGKITVAVDGSKTLELSLNNIDFEYQADSSYFPVAVDVSAYIDPYVITLKETKVGNNFTVQFDMSNNSSCVYDVDVEIDLATSDYSSVIDEDVTLVKGTFGFEKFEVAANVKVSEIAALGDAATVDQVNSKISATVSYDGAKIGDLKLFEVAPDSVRLYIYYKDNTSEDVLQVYGEDFKTDMEGVWTDITGPWDEQTKKKSWKKN
ncbi:MAG: hypothetical protein NT150_10515 [Bacteroidetes bacterium]|nr:hypothetical protein [Bacteroidota bacterium]